MPRPRGLPHTPPSPAPIPDPTRPLVFLLVKFPDCSPAKEHPSFASLSQIQALVDPSLQDAAQGVPQGDAHHEKTPLELQHSPREALQAGLLKAIKLAKGSYWSNFLAKTTPQNIWTAKQYVAPRKTPRFPSLPGADSPAAINNALLEHFFPLKPNPPARRRLSPHPEATPLSQEEIETALSRCSPYSAPGPDGIPYRAWKRVNAINPAILLDLLSPLVTLGYHPPCLKHAFMVVLDKPGKPS